LSAIPALFSDKMTLTITVVRHAQSAGKQSGQHDFDRVLTEGGQRWVATLKKKLPDTVPPIDILIASAATRVKQTVQPLIPALGLSGTQCRFENELYEATSDDWIRTLQPLITTHHLAYHHLVGAQPPPAQRRRAITY
jgi:phosphohistidine phosphatase SixA